MKAIIDCNNFYCSCERWFRPELNHRPVVVLSNNDGCIISIRQRSAAKTVTMFVVPKEEGEQVKYKHGPTEAASIILPAATSDTALLIKPAMSLAQKLFRKGNIYKKAGVVLSGLEPDKSIQANLFVAPSKNVRRYLMNTLDNINFSMRDDIVKFASSGTKKDWKMRQELRSHRYTSRWEELKQIG